MLKEKSKMSKKIVIINGSPTPGGNTRCLSEAVLEGAKEAGNEGVIIDLASLSIAPYAGPTQPEDDMTRVADEMRTADVVVIASPLYWMQFTGQIKIWMDRLSTVGKEILAGKETALLACAASPAEVIEKNLLGYYRMCFVDSLGWKNMGSVLAGGVYAPGQVRSTPYCEQAKELGKIL